jgi:hypothetical protein
MNKLQRTLAYGGVACGLATAVAACGSSSNSSADTTPVAPTVTVTQTESTSSPATSTPAGPAACATANLKVSLGTGQGAAGHEIYPLVFSNAGTAPCQLDGFPGVSYVTGAQGTQVGAAAIRNGPAGSPVTLQPGASATAQLSVGSTGPYDPATCKAVAATGLRVYPPGSTQASFVPQPLTVCSNPALNTLQVETLTAS